MSDVMRPQPFEVLLRWILVELEARREIFGIPEELFFRPSPGDPFAVEDFLGSRLDTPIGPAAGPHTQMAQNIVAAWLSGGRFIELKTVQILDEIEVPRPCIDMEDEGYNVEWSQELRLEQSAWEYIKAWALIHILRRSLGFEDRPFGTIFNMSVGYDLKGITSPRMVRFMDRLQDASAELTEIKGVLKERFPRFADIEIPPRIVNSVTLSTMHGCPPDEIEQIAAYLLQERKLHTFVKLNPTLLGKEEVERILHDDLGFTEIEVPEEAFAHDLQYEEALGIIRRLQAVAREEGLVFGVKLSNTLPVRNHKGRLPGEEMYMSGRALYPITMNLFWRLVRDLDGDLIVSYAGGADAENVVEILSCGALPVTMASDLLKPGGYSRMLQYLENIRREMERRGARSLDELRRDALENLERAAEAARRSPRYHKNAFPYGLPKVNSGLGLFDCIVAPCVEPCAVFQDVPDYLRYIEVGDFGKALRVIMARNPLPGITGHVCTHLCQSRCTRNNYDEPLAIQALKRAAAEYGGDPGLEPGPPTGKRVAVIGSGPAGLSAAYFLALNGVEVTIFEAKERPGGTIRLIPPFRLPEEVIERDIERILSLGVHLEASHPLTKAPEGLLEEGFDAVFVSPGMQRDLVPNIPEIQGEGVYFALDLLSRVREGERPALGRRVLVVGGGDTAMDAARVALRLTNDDGEVVVLYRRSRAEMPAAPEEVEEALEEGVRIEELVSPVRVLRRDGALVGLECVRNELGEPGPDGRRRPVPIPGSEFVQEADAVIFAIGQVPDLGFLEGSRLEVGPNGTIKADPDGRTRVPGVYAGGDILGGRQRSIIAAVSHGMRAARAICRDLGIHFRLPDLPRPEISRDEIPALKRRRARREHVHRPPRLSPAERKDFRLVESTYSPEEARAEAGRCLQCSRICDKCVDVCPNRANLVYTVPTVSWEVPVLGIREGVLSVVGTVPFRVTQERQILHLDDFCNECGNCDTFCVHRGKPYRDKPRLFLREENFRAERDNAFYISGDTIRRREGGWESSLRLVEGGFVYEDHLVWAELSSDFVVRRMELLRPFAGTHSLVGAAEMAVVLLGARESLPFLPVWGGEDG